MRVTTKGRISDLVFSVIIFSRISRVEFLIVGMFWSVAGALGWSNPKMGFLGFAVKWGMFWSGDFGKHINPPTGT